MRLQELSADIEDLKEICCEKGVMEYEYEEALAVRRHRRSFYQMCIAHPVGGTATLAEVLSIFPVLRMVNAMAHSASNVAAVSRDMLSAYQELVAQYPWAFSRCHGERSRLPFLCRSLRVLGTTASFWLCHFWLCQSWL